ncbi:FeoA family protein [Demequina sp. SYSU T00039]|uniref:FeoA family protein n=1 Tax=Demequina lignilytica TaxID=3051663 RepID=A0AAW7MAA4_9MICO|nr:MULTISPECIES: FeoA family protein [unclassified Demequina]MDN4478951.1 FeoA family protein [Demequina sp. SYSU T00039-1]MDN4488826.1 FeoA family protein [Demequina sp. SYSU T00039]MDN4491461.1 FeoA family protein [Demequina sp. SYSU T00068]
MLLHTLAPGAVARIRSISADAPVALRLREMGLRPGIRVRVAGRAASGARVVAVGGARIAVDRQTSALIEVDPA